MAADVKGSKRSSILHINNEGLSGITGDKSRATEGLVPGWGGGEVVQEAPAVELYKAEKASHVNWV